MASCIRRKKFSSLQDKKEINIGILDTAFYDICGWLHQINDFPVQVLSIETSAFKSLIHCDQINFKTGILNNVYITFIKQGLQEEMH